MRSDTRWNSGRSSSVTPRACACSHVNGRRVEQLQTPAIVIAGAAHELVEDVQAVDAAGEQAPAERGPEPEDVVALVALLPRDPQPFRVGSAGSRIRAYAAAAGGFPAGDLSSFLHRARRTLGSEEVGFATGLPVDATDVLDGCDRVSGARRHTRTRHLRPGAARLSGPGGRREFVIVRTLVMALVAAVSGAVAGCVDPSPPKRRSSTSDPAGRSPTRARRPTSRTSLRPSLRRSSRSGRGRANISNLFNSLPQPVRAPVSSSDRAGRSSPRRRSSRARGRSPSRPRRRPIAAGPDPRRSTRRRVSRS